MKTGKRRKRDMERGGIGKRRRRWKERKKGRGKMRKRENREEK